MDGSTPQPPRAAYDVGGPEPITGMIVNRPANIRQGWRSGAVVTACERRRQAPADLRGTRVALSVSGLPGGVTASFSPSAAAIGGRPVLTLTTAPSSAAGAFAATVTAMTLSSDPIGTSTPLGLTISAS